MIHDLTFFTSLDIFLFYAFCSVAGIQLFYIVFIYARFAFFTREIKKQKNLPPLSLVIITHNKANLLAKYLPKFLEQNYPEFEVIVVLNQSNDDSKFILARYQEQYKHLKFTSIERNKHLSIDKKLPFNLASKAARYAHFVLADIHYPPSSERWLYQLGTSHSGNISLVLGYNNIEKTNSLFNIIIRQHTAWHFINMFSYTLAKLSVIGSIRNVSFIKPVFNSIIESEKNDFFIPKRIKNNHASIIISPESFVFSKNKLSWSEWLTELRSYQKIHARVGIIKKLIIKLYPLSLFLFYGLFITLIFEDFFTLINLLIFVFIFCLKWFIQGFCFIKLGEKKGFYLFPFFELFYFVWMPIVYYTDNSKTIINERS